MEKVLNFNQSAPLGSVLDIPRVAPQEALKGLLSENKSESLDASEKLRSMAKHCGLSLRQLLNWRVDPTKAPAEDRARFGDLSGYEVALMSLNLPTKDSHEHGVIMQAAADTFNRFPGTRALFPEVMDDMLRWKNRQDQIERLEPMIAQSRTIGATEVISVVVEDDSADRGTFQVAEMARIPVRTIRTSQNTVAMYKHGSGYRVSYEFSRRASLDILTPYAARVARELEISKVKMATSVLINGDGVNAAAPVTGITTYGGVAVDGSNPLSGQYKAIAKWIMARANAGTPIDTILGNYDMLVELLFMFTPTLNGQRSLAESLAQKGAPAIAMPNIPILNGTVNFVLSSAMPANRLLGYTKAETLEELVEAGSQISEDERAVSNQVTTYYNTEVSGFKLAFGDTRSVLNVAA